MSTDYKNDPEFGGSVPKFRRTVVACVRRVDPAGRVSKAIKTFATMTADLLDLSDWLAVQGVKVVAMESTGTYWKPVFNLLEPRLPVVLVNAHHIKQVPGRKTDVKDSEWIAQLLQHGLLRSSTGCSAPASSHPDRPASCGT